MDSIDSGNRVTIPQQNPPAENNNSVCYRGIKVDRPLQTTSLLDISSKTSANQLVCVTDRTLRSVLQHNHNGVSETRSDRLSSFSDKINPPNHQNRSRLAAVLLDALGSCDFRATFTALNFLNEEYDKVASPYDTSEQSCKHVERAIHKLRTIADGGCKLSDQADIALRTTLGDHARNFLNTLALAESAHQEASFLLASCVNSPALRQLVAHCEDFWADDLGGRELSTRQLIELMPQYLDEQPAGEQMRGKIKISNRAASSASSDMVKALLVMIANLSTASASASASASATGGSGSSTPNPTTGSPSITGSKGENGTTGEMGTTGNQGDRGLKGDRGYKGYKGDQGDQGPKGDRGLKGRTGTLGFKGFRGVSGMKGDAGEDGHMGDKGALGLKGDIGYQGVKGAPGQCRLEDIPDQSDCFHSGVKGGIVGGLIVGGITVGAYCSYKLYQWYKGYNRTASVDYYNDAHASQQLDNDQAQQGEYGTWNDFGSQASRPGSQASGLDVVLTETNLKLLPCSPGLRSRGRGSESSCSEHTTDSDRVRRDTVIPGQDTSNRV